VADEPLAPALSEVVPVITASTFRDWGDFRRWYAEAVRGFSEPDEQVRRLAAELTGGKGSREDKLRAIFKATEDLDQAVDTSTPILKEMQETIGEMEPILGDLERNVKKLIMAQHDDIEEEFDRLEKTIDQKLIYPKLGMKFMGITYREVNRAGAIYVDVYAGVGTVDPGARIIITTRRIGGTACTTAAGAIEADHRIGVGGCSTDDTGRHRNSYS